MKGGKKMRFVILFGAILIATAIHPTQEISVIVGFTIYFFTILSLVADFVEFFHNLKK